MGNGAWSNDQANQIIVYDASTGKVILRVDSTGLYYMNVSNGSYFKVTADANLGNDVAVLLEPGASAIPGVVYIPAELVAGEYTSSTITSSALKVISPYIANKLPAEIDLYGQSNDSATDNSEIDFGAAYLYGTYGSQMGQGTLNANAAFTSPNITSTTEIIADYASEAGGHTNATRYTGVRWSGTIQSTVAGDSIGLRVYSSSSNSSLTGATLLFDMGQIKIDTASVPKPFSFDCSFPGQPGKYICLGARRASGTGTGFISFTARKYEDIYHL